MGIQNSMARLIEVNPETEWLTKNAYNTLRAEELSKDRIQELEETLSKRVYEAEEQIQLTKNENDHELELAYRRRRKILKRIADGLAWRMIGFGSYLIRGFAIGYSPGFMVGKVGYHYERNIVRAAYAQPNVTFAIQCDITNILRITDVIIVKSNGEIKPCEVKSGKKRSKSGRDLKRQRYRQREIIDFILHGTEGPVGISGLTWRGVNNPDKTEHYWNKFEQLAIKAVDEEISWEQVDAGIILSVFKTGLEGKIEFELASIVKQLNWPNPLITFRYLNKHIDGDLREVDSPLACIPLTIFPVDPAIGFRFINGELNGMVIFDINRVYSELEKLGIKTIPSGTREKRVQTAHGYQVGIGIGEWNHLYYELRTLPSFIRGVKTSLDEIDRNFLQSGISKVNSMFDPV